MSLSMFWDASLDFCGLANVRWRGSAVYVCHAHIWHCSGPQPVCQFMLFKFHFQSNVKLCNYFNVTSSVEIANCKTEGR